MNINNYVSMYLHMYIDIITSTTLHNTQIIKYLQISINACAYLAIVIVGLDSVTTINMI